MFRAGAKKGEGGERKAAKEGSEGEIDEIPSCRLYI